MATTVTGKMVMPNGTPIQGATITAYLNEFGAESNSLEVYPSDVLVTATSDVNGLWSLSLWPTNGSVSNTKYVFNIQTSSSTIPKTYILDVPNQATVLFSDLLAGVSARDILNQLLDSDPAVYNMTVYRGITFYREFLMQDGRNEPINLSGYSAKLQVVDSYGSVILTVASIPVTADGYIQVTLSATATAALTINTGNYDLILSYTDKVYIVLQGKLTILDTITKI